MLPNLVAFFPTVPLWRGLFYPRGPRAAFLREVPLLLPSALRTPVGNGLFAEGPRKCVTLLSGDFTLEMYERPGQPGAGEAA